MKTTVTILLGIISATAWGWTDYLVAGQHLTLTQRFWILVVLTGVLITQQVYLALPEPSSHGMVASRQTLIENYLRTLLEDYEQLVGESLVENESLPQIRINVMLPTKRLRGLLPTQLKIYYSVCSSGVSYSHSELELGWKKRQGNCGWAWHNGKISLYTSGNQPQSVFKMTQNQAGQTGSINSILSVPIWHNESCLGILNIDSQKSSTGARLDREEIQLRAAAVARNIGGNLFPDGVGA